MASRAKYKTFTELATAFATGELSRDEYLLLVDDDSSLVVRRDGVDMEEMLFVGEVYIDIMEACKIVGIPAEFC